MFAYLEGHPVEQNLKTCETIQEVNQVAQANFWNSVTVSDLRSSDYISAVLSVDVILLW